MALIGIKKLNTEEALASFNPEEWDVSCGCYSYPCFKRNKDTGEVTSLPDKIKVEYFMHMKGNADLNRKHIQKNAAKAILALLGKQLKDCKEVPNY